MAYLLCSFPPPRADAVDLCFDKTIFVNETVKLGFDLQGKQLRRVWVLNGG